MTSQVVPVLNAEKSLAGNTMVSVNNNQFTHNVRALVASCEVCTHWFPHMVVIHRPWKMCLDAVPHF